MTEGFGGWGGPTEPSTSRECGYPTEPPTLRTSGYADILAKRDMLLRELDALRNKVAGMNFAIDVVAEELAASGMEARRAETGTGSVHDSPVPKADAQTLPTKGAA